MTTTPGSVSSAGSKTATNNLSFDDGLLTVEGENVSFVADDFVEKILTGELLNLVWALKSTISQIFYVCFVGGPSENIKSSPKGNASVVLPIIDAKVLNDLEENCEGLSNSVDAVLQEITTRLSKVHLCVFS